MSPSPCAVLGRRDQHGALASIGTPRRGGGDGSRSLAETCVWGYATKRVPGLPPTAVPPHIVGSLSETRKRPPPKARLLIAAEAVFSGRGYAHTTVEEVLRAADVLA